MNSDGTNASLSGANNEWSLWQGTFPIEYLKLPGSAGTSSTRPTPVHNEIEVQVNVGGCTNPGWAVEVDWAAISVVNAPRPVVFVSGWGEGYPRFNTFRQWLLDDRMPTAYNRSKGDDYTDSQVDTGSGLLTIPDTAAQVRQTIDHVLNRFGVDKVNLVSHSKGGLFSRAAVSDGSTATHVDHLITISTPHHGTELGYLGALLPGWLGGAALGCAGYTNPSDNAACVAGAAEIRVDPIRNFNFSSCDLVNGWQYCVPRGENWQQFGISYHSLSGGSFGGSPADVGVTATYPWNSNTWNSPTRDSFPTEYTEDALFPYGHMDIKETIEPYHCVVSFFNPTLYPAGSSCSYSAQLAAKDSTITPAAVATGIIWPQAQHQIIGLTTRTVPANGSQTVSVKLDGSGSALLNVWSGGSVTVSLVDPNGQTITPTVASGDPALTYFAQYGPIIGDGSAWWYQYKVSPAIPGTWSYVIQASSTNSVLVWTATDSTTRLRSTTNKLTYRPNDIVTVEASLASGSTVVTGSTITGTLTTLDRTPISSLTFYDDGTHGDVSAGNSVYTAQFSAPATTGYMLVTTYGSKGAIARTSDTTITIGPQTASIQNGATATTPDANGNGLYDSLNLSVQIATTAVGHFDVAGTLLNSSGEQVATALYTTRTNNGGTWPTGTHSIVLRFDGTAIRASAKNGPYTLSIRVQDTTGTPREVASASNAYTTAAYQATQFEGPFLAITGGSETALDINGNGKYDQLDIRVALSVLRPGQYNWNGQLVDQQGVDLGWSQGSGTINSQTPIRFSFSGKSISANGQNGPYTLRNVSVYQLTGITNGYTATAIFSPAYTTTGAYTATQFESTATASCTSNGVAQIAGGSEDDNTSVPATPASPAGAFRVLLPVVQKQSSDASSAVRVPNREERGRLPLSFIANAGQTDALVRFQARGAGGMLFFTPRETVFVLPETDPTLDTTLLPSIARLRYDGANQSPDLHAATALPGVVNYLVGDNPALWRTNITTYDGVTYGQLYPGIDLQYTGTDGQLKSTYVITPGADPSPIRWHYTGATDVTVDATTGDLHISLRSLNPLRSGRTLIEHAPVAWQVSDTGEQVPVSARFAVAVDRSISFVLGSYDHSKPLLIDPLLTYSSYLGGGASDKGNAIKLDSNCNMYLTGSTYAYSFPVQDPIQGSQGGGLDAFVTKISANGSTILYSTYLGGSSDDKGEGIAVDSSGNIAITGKTGSSNFPTYHALDSTFGGGTCASAPCGDIFITALNAAGSAFRYSTYMGGTGNDEGTAITVDSSGNLYATGATAGSLTAKNAYDSSQNGGADAFMVKINPTASGSSSLLYSTYLGGSSDDQGNGIAVDSGGKVAVVGETFSTAFPTKNARQSSNGGQVDAFVTRLDPAASGTSSLLYSTYLGGTIYDKALGVGVDSAGAIYVTGYTQSDNFPTVNAWQTTRSGNRDAFIAKVNPTASGTASLVYSTFIGGSGEDWGLGIAVVRTDHVVITGWTGSSDLPTLNPVQVFFGGGTCSSAPCTDAFVTDLDIAHNALVYSTYLGGNDADEGHGVIVDSLGAAYITGFTNSGNFATTSEGLSQSLNTSGYSDAFIVKITP